MSMNYTVATYAFYLPISVALTVWVEPPRCHSGSDRVQRYVQHIGGGTGTDPIFDVPSAE